MSLADTLWMEVEQEAQTTKRVLDRVPASKLSWKPHPEIPHTGPAGAPHCVRSRRYRRSRNAGHLRGARI